MNKKITIYQVLPRLFGNTKTNCKPYGTLQENGVGKFEDFTPKALQSIRDLGITHIWYTGIIQHAKTTSYETFGIPDDHPTLIKGRAGSPYAIKNYYDVDPDLAIDVNKRMGEFMALIDRAHESGLKTIIDFVPNHVFRQYKSHKNNFGDNDDVTKAFDAQNNFYYLPGQEFELPEDINWLEEIKNELPKTPYKEIPAKVTGNDQFTNHPGRNDWYETIKLNYGVDYENNKACHFDPVPDTWNKMLDILLFWAGKNVDGFRCDMAEMVPVEFWGWAIKQVKDAFPEILFIAEIYNPFEYHNYIKRGGFDFIYDKIGLYDTLKNILVKNISARTITNCWQVLDGIDAHMLRFIENHDEIRLASAAFAGDPKAAIPAMTVSATLNTGPAMIYFGQEVGEPAQEASGFSGNNGRTTIYDYFHVPEHQKWMNDGKFDGGKLSADQHKLRQFYQKLLHLCQRNEAISQGRFYDLMWANTDDLIFDRDKIYSYLRFTQNQQLLFVVNFDRHNTKKLTIKIPEHAFGEMGLNNIHNFQIKELLWNKIDLNFSRDQVFEQGIEMEIGPWDAYIFEVVKPPRASSQA
ncbi:MAG: alpha-amylase [Bacteroidetes bacterium 4484_276]|nr:MAG: alpha-amylase [Bacteroidetes bacterium 4484_276]OYT14143.1 MAG: alpha-amylase [Bacteroidetes bacterium 4572_114]